MVIVCRTCGTHNAGGDAFCGTCGGFLEWVGEKVAPAVSAEVLVEAEQLSSAPRRNLLQRVVSAGQGLVITPPRKALLADPTPMPLGGGTPDPPPAGAGVSAPPRPPGASAPPRPPGASAPPRPPGAAAPPPRPPAAAPKPPATPPPRPPKPPAPTAAAPTAAAPTPPAPTAVVRKPPAPPRPPSRSAVASPAPSGAAPEPDEAADGTPTQPVGALVAPVHRPDPVEEQAAPAERRPEASRPKVAPVSRTVSTRRLRPGDLICGACGEGNLPVRRFCGRCGESLRTAEVVRVRWWRRLLRRNRAKVVAATRRPGSPAVRTRFGFRDTLRRIYRVGRIVVGLVVLLGGILYAAYPPLRTEINAQVTGVERKVTNRVDQTFVPVHAVKVQASAQNPGHPASAAFDEVLDTYWSAPAAPGQNPTVTMTFAHPMTLEKMIVHAGAADGFTAHGRPALLLLVFSNQETDTVTVQDTDKAQTLTISHAVQVSSVQIQVAATYAGGAPPDVAIDELELFALNIP